MPFKWKLLNCELCLFLLSWSVCLVFLPGNVYCTGERLPCRRVFVITCHILLSDEDFRAGSGFPWELSMLCTAVVTPLCSAKTLGWTFMTHHVQRFLRSLLRCTPLERGLKCVQSSHDRGKCCSCGLQKLWASLCYSVTQLWFQHTGFQDRAQLLCASVMWIVLFAKWNDCEIWKYISM